MIHLQYCFAWKNQCSEISQIFSLASYKEKEQKQSTMAVEVGPEKDKE